MFPDDLSVVGTSSNLRPLAIFTSYMALCLSLTTLILRTLHSQSKALFATSSKSASSSSVRLICFAFLAVLSLATTWYYMLRFFEFSYRAWASTHSVAFDANQPQLGRWLRDTKLFKEAWHIALATPARLWWTQQIFFFSAGWSVFLDRQGHHFNVPHLWAFMLLGQVVAISFATNLFFLTALFYRTRCSPPSPLKQDSANSASASPHPRTLVWTPFPALLVAPLTLTFTAVIAIPYTLTSPYFLTFLVAPHVLLFLPPLLHRLVPSAWGTSREVKEAEAWYAKFYGGVVVCAALLQGKATLNVVREGSAGAESGGYGGVLGALYEHPAVSSVGWDVILCWVSWGMWIVGEIWKPEEDEGHVDRTNKKEL